MESAKKEIIYWAKRLYDKNMSPARSGNISIKFENGILISATGTCLGDLEENDIVFTDYNGKVLSGDKKPSGEKTMHSEIYTKRDDINAIIHCHCPVISSFAVANTEINEAIMPDFVVLFGKIPIIPYFCPSSIELAEAAGKMFEKYNVILLQNHGVVAGAKTLKDAFYLLETLRAYCETYFGAQVIGSAYKLKKKDINEIKKLFLT